MPIDAVICEPLRTPIGRFGGAFAQQTPAALAAHVIAEIVARTGIDPARVDEVILGHAYPTSEAPAIGRVAALDAGLPTTVTGSQTDRRCGSGLQAVLDAAMQIRAGFSEVVIAAWRRRDERRPLLHPRRTLGHQGPRPPAPRRTRPGPCHRRRRQPPGPRRHDRDGGEPAQGVLHQPRRPGRPGPAVPTARSAAPPPRAVTTRRPSPSPYAPARARRPSPPTNTPAPTPPPNNSPHSGR